MKRLTNFLRSSAKKTNDLSKAHQGSSTKKTKAAKTTTTSASNAPNSSSYNESKIDKQVNQLVKFYKKNNLHDTAAFFSHIVKKPIQEIQQELTIYQPKNLLFKTQNSTNLPTYYFQDNQQNIHAAIRQQHELGPEIRFDNTPIYRFFFDDPDTQLAVNNELLMEMDQDDMNYLIANPGAQLPGQIRLQNKLNALESTNGYDTFIQKKSGYLLEVAKHKNCDYIDALHPSGGLAQGIHRSEEDDALKAYFRSKIITSESISLLPTLKDVYIKGMLKEEELDQLMNTEQRLRLSQLQPNASQHQYLSEKIRSINDAIQKVNNELALFETSENQLRQQIPKEHQSYFTRSGDL